MTIDNSFIFPFANRANSYIYDVNTNTIIKVSRELYENLNDSCITQIDRKISQAINNLRQEGYLSSNRIKQIEHPYTEILPYMLKRRLNTITLQVTQQCNLRCSYCAYSGTYKNRIHSNKSMSLETAKKAIDYVINNSSDSPSFHVGFYGGEPLLRFDFIKDCVAYVKSKSRGKDVLFNMTTNGTLLDHKVMDFLVDNDFNILISLDGPENIHDRNRVFSSNNKGTYKVIMNNIENFRIRYPEFVNKNISFNAVVDSRCEFDCTNDFFCNYEDIKHNDVNMSSISKLYSNEVFIENEEFYNQLKYEKFKLLLNKIRKLDDEYVSKLMLVEFLNLNEKFYKRNLNCKISEKEHPGGPCIPGIRKLFVNVNGVFYSCERVSEESKSMVIGNVDIGLDIDKMNCILNIGKITEGHCKNCWAFRFCYLCAAFADNTTELSAESRLSHCSSVKIDVLEKMKDLCTLIEHGCTFEDSSIDYIEV